MRRARRSDATIRSVRKNRSSIWKCQGSDSSFFYFIVIIIISFGRLALFRHTFNRCELLHNFNITQLTLSKVIQFKNSIQFKWKNLDKSSLLIFSFSQSLVGLLSGRLISYINIDDRFAERYIHCFLSSLCSLEFLSLEVIYMTFLETEMKELGRSTWNDTQHNIVLQYLPSMSQMSCSRKTPSRWKSMNTHTHHIQVAVRRCSSKQLFLKILQYSQEYTCVGVSFYVSL